MVRVERVLVALHVLGVIVMVTFGSLLLVRTTHQEQETSRVLDTMRIAYASEDSVLHEIRNHQTILAESIYRIESRLDALAR